MTIPLTLSQVPAVTPYAQYIATALQTIFPYPFPITQDSDLVVVVDGVTYTTDVGYSVSGQGNATGGFVTFTTPLAGGTIVTVFRDIVIERITQIAQNSGYSSVAFNAEFNNIYLIMQQLSEKLAYALQIPYSNNPAPVTTLTAGAYANAYLSFDANGNPVPATLTSAGAITQILLGQVLYPQTAAEAAAGVTPTYPFYSPGDLARYGGIDDNSTDNTSAIDSAIAVGGTTRVRCYSTGIYCTAGGHVLADGVSFIGEGKRTGSPYRGSGFRLTANATMFTYVARNSLENLELSTTTTGAPFTSAGTAISIGTLTAFAGSTVTRKCRIFNFHVGIQNSGGLFGTIEDCSITNNNYGVYYYNTGATTSNSMVWKNNQIFGNQRGGVFGSMASRGVGHSFIGGSIEGNCSEDVATYTAQVKGLICSQISFRNVYMEYSNGAVAGPDFLSISGLSDGAIEDCYFNLSTAISGTGIISSAAGSSRMRIFNNRFLGANFTNDINLPGCIQMRCTDNDGSGATNVLTGAGSQYLTGRVAPTITRHGSWTPVIVGNVTPGTQTYSVQVGFYNQIDNLVHFRCRITMTAKDGATAGNIQITGLPVASEATVNGYHLFAVGVENFAQTAAHSGFVARLTAGATVLDIMENGDNTTLVASVAANLKATTSLYVTGVYEIANPA